ncbi:Eukaryotic translation initiation factor 2-alpha kinase 1 [Madurella mycetomatis]|uniref:Eukaryotic translation initiation factor 2-alpha kinase 1 n=1 Tax=Madurella mycetomatis TaxID=100816 RepID=A0A175WCY9_9PEZI|nr:Eukaryotic translation initiation factor 2-alpha kinase 1 [Madurella mycetomatis]
MYGQSKEKSQSSLLNLFSPSSASQVAVLKYRRAKQDVNNKVAILEAVWVKVETQLKFLRRISEQGRLNDELAQCHFMLLQKLHSTLLQAVSQLEMSASSIESASNKFFRFGRWKHALLKKSLDALMVELEAWQNRFDPSWYLIILIGDSVLDPVLAAPGQERAVNMEREASPLNNLLGLRQAIEAENSPTTRQPNTVDFDASRLADAKESIIPYTVMKFIQPESGEVLVIEPVDLPSGISSQSITDAGNLSRKLQHIDPKTFGLLRCEGLLKITDSVNGGLTALEVVYRGPCNRQQPTTLRQLLLDQREVSLSAVVSLSKQLVRSVSYIHACDFVHKNIRPDNIILFPSSSCPIGAAYLLGFTQFRSLAHQTNRFGDSAWHRNLYRHPARQGLCILDEYVMQHDIYSLGVCLLEIGLWKPLVWYPRGNGDGTVAPVPGLVLALRTVLSDKVFERAHSKQDKTAWVKEDLVDMARRLLPAKMGDAYTEVVVSCLTCLDEGSEDFGSCKEESKGNSITIGVRFVEKILTRMAEIRV